MLRADRFFDRVARAARPSQPLWRLSVSPWLARVLVAAGARRKPAPDEMNVSHRVHAVDRPASAADEADAGEGGLTAMAMAGERGAALIVGDLLVERGRVDEAIAILRVHADEGDEYTSWRLANLLAESGRVDEAKAILQVHADKGRVYARRLLADLRAGRSHHGSAPYRRATKAHPMAMPYSRDPPAGGRGRTADEIAHVDIAETYTRDIVEFLDKRWTLAESDVGRDRRRVLLGSGLPVGFLVAVFSVVMAATVVVVPILIALRTVGADTAQLVTAMSAAVGGGTVALAVRAWLLRRRARNKSRS